MIMISQKNRLQVAFLALAFLIVTPRALHALQINVQADRGNGKVNFDQESAQSAANWSKQNSFVQALRELGFNPDVQTIQANISDNSRDLLAAKDSAVAIASANNVETTSYTSVQFRDTAMKAVITCSGASYSKTFAPLSVAVEIHDCKTDDGKRAVIPAHNFPSGH